VIVKSGPQTTQGNIIVVDDQPANLKLMEDMLRQQGYGVRSFPRGRMALTAASEQPPDLILLDINMPEMNGFEVCERLKADQKLAFIPVIFLSALNETDDKVRAFRAGGVDYITKPFQFEEVQARVETHLSLYFHTHHLEELVQDRTRELAETQGRLKVLDRAKSDFLQLISHEFRTPLNGLFGIGEILLEEMNSSGEEDGLRDLFEQSRRRIITILDDALLLTQIDVEGERFTPKSVDVQSIVCAAIRGASDFAVSRHVTISAAKFGTDSVVGDEDLLAKALQALLEAAVKFSTEGQSVRLFCRPTNEVVNVTIESAGRIIPAHAISRFFDLFSIGEAITVGGDLGLGPPVASRILSLFGGSVTVENREPPGIQIQVSFTRGNG
jgi:two-component system, sensor histidine kinase and response regulator